jgi:S1-C subfamily serine protease
MHKVIVAVVGAAVLSGTGFAQDVLQLRGPGSQIGVTIRDVSDGVAIDSVRSGSPGERAGFKSGDVVVTFDGETIRSARQLTRVVEETPPGKPVAAVVLRDGTRQTLTVTPGAGVADIKRLPGITRYQRSLPDVAADFRRQLRDRNFDLAFPGTRPFAPQRLGAELTPLSNQLAGYFGVNAGVLVSSVDSNSPAALAGLRSGDVITAIDGRMVDEVGDLSDPVGSASQGSSIELRVTRDKKEVTLKVGL